MGVEEGGVNIGFPLRRSQVYARGALMDFTKRKEKNLPAARGDAEWRGAAWSLPQR